MPKDQVSYWLEYKVRGGEWQAVPTLHDDPKEAEGDLSDLLAAWGATIEDWLIVEERTRRTLRVWRSPSA